MHRKAMVLAVVLTFVAALSISSSKPSFAQDSSDDRISALETQVAELEATVAALSGSEEPAAEAAPVDADTSAVRTESAATGAPASASTTGYLSGNAFDLLPPGTAGELAVVAQGIYDGMSLPLLLRNNTEEALVRVSVSVSVYDATGALLAVGEASDLTPARVEPGTYAFGNAYFDFATFPSDVTYNFQATGESADSAAFIGHYDLTIQESNYLGDRIVGTAVNGQEFTLDGPFGVDAACFGSDGGLLGIANDYAAVETADPGVSVTFQVTLYNVASCDIYLVGGSGYHF